MIIHPGVLSGTITIPPSKSITHRALILAALGNGESVLTNVLFSEDTLLTIQALRALGVKIISDEVKKVVTVEGLGGKFTTDDVSFDVGNSGTTARLLMAVSALKKGITTITGSRRLFERPFDDLIKVLKQQGVSVEKQSDAFVIESPGVLPGGEISISGKLSSQFVSGLLLIAPCTRHAVKLSVTDLRSRPYVDVTINLMKQSGINITTSKKSGEVIFEINPSVYQTTDYAIEGDYSAASYFLAANALGSTIVIKGLADNSLQADSVFAHFKKLDDIPDTIDMGNSPDSVPTLAILSAFKKGKTAIINIGHLRGKETDRITALSTELSKMGIKVSSTKDSLTITGGIPHGAIIETYNDHRIAMSCAIAGLFATGTTIIKNPGVVGKSYPEFWNDLEKLGAQIAHFSPGVVSIPPPRWKKSNLVLIGMRGAGKSTIGKLLAEKLDMTFVQTDEMIENLEHMKIAEIVKIHGWDYFRSLEKALCEELRNRKNAVIATGGGIVINSENIHNLRKNGVVIYLKANLPTLVDRVGSDNNRPSLTGESDINKDMHKTLLARKSQYENAADYIIETDNKSAQETIKEICSKLSS